MFGMGITEFLALLAQNRIILYVLHNGLPMGAISAGRPRSSLVQSGFPPDKGDRLTNQAEI
jgi:hypothetical protein